MPFVELCLDALKKAQVDWDFVRAVPRSGIPAFGTSALPDTEEDVQDMKKFLKTHTSDLQVRAWLFVCTVGD